MHNDNCPLNQKPQDFLVFKINPKTVTELFLSSRV